MNFVCSPLLLLTTFLQLSNTEIPHTIPVLCLHYVKRFLLRSYSGPYFSAFGLNTERHGDRMRKNADQNNSEYGHFLQSASLSSSLAFAFFFQPEKPNKTPVKHL